MKLVKFLACLAGTGFVRNVGDVAPVPDDEAARLIAAGFAEPAPERAATTPEVVAPKPTDKKPDEPKRRAGRTASAPAVVAPAPVETPAVPAPVEAAPVETPAAGSSDAPADPSAEKPQ